MGICLLAGLSPQVQATRQPRFDLRARAGAVLELEYLPDGRLAAAYPDDTIRIWDPQKRELVVTIPVLRPTLDGQAATSRQGSRIESISVSPDGKVIAEVFSRSTGSGSLRTWDAATGRRLLDIEEGLANVRCVAFSPDGKQLACNMPDRERGGHMIALLSASDGKVMQRLRGDRLSASGLAFAPDGKRLAGYGGVRVHIWALDGDKAPQVLSGHQNAIQAVAWSPDGATLASAELGPRERIILWDGQSGAKVREMTPQAEGITDLAFSPSGRTLAAAGADRGLRLYNPETGKLRERLYFHLQRMTCVAFSRDGRTLATGGQDGLIGIWDYDESLPDLEYEQGDANTPETGKRRQEPPQPPAPPRRPSRP